MKTLRVDDKRRLRIGNLKPGQVFSRTDNPDGSIVLVPVVEVKRSDGPRFPRGSLLKYLTPERDAEQLAILSGCVQHPE